MNNLIEYFRENYPDLVLIGDEDSRTNYTDAIVGVDGNNERAIYSRQKLIECFMQHDGMTYDEAAEWVSYNVDRALPYWGQHAPIIMDDIEE